MDIMYIAGLTALGTGMRVGEVTGLRWCDIDWAGNMIEVNHTLVYYNHAENGCYFNVHTPKTEAGKRRIPMLQSVREAFLEEKKYQEQFGLKCIAEIDGYTDFIFINRFGGVQHQGTLNEAIQRIIRYSCLHSADIRCATLLPQDLWNQM